MRDADSAAQTPASFTGNAGIDIGTTSADKNQSTLATVDEFYNDPLLTQLIHQGLTNNRELKVLDEEVEIAKNEVLARQGAYLPFVTAGYETSLEKSSLYTRNGAVDSQLDIRPGQATPNPLLNHSLGLNVFWRLDIWKAMRNAQEAANQRYLASIERRNYFVTRMVAEIAENYYHLMSLDMRLETLDKTIELQQQSLEIAKVKKEAGRGNELAVQRFQAEVKKNQSEKLIVKQEIIESENHINLLLNRYPTTIERKSSGFLDVNIQILNSGIPSQLLHNRPDIRQAEREIQAAGLDVDVARAQFYPDLTISGGVGYQAFNPKYLFVTPDALIANVAGGLIVPVINRKAIEADYLSANARQLQSVYNYQRVVLTAFTEVINRLSLAENYRKSIEVKKQQLDALVSSVEVAGKLFQNARAEYVEVLLAQRDMMEARMVLIETKKQQLSAVVNAYQALGGGDMLTMPTTSTTTVRKTPQP
ncbi:MAG: efflux transporter outer membrane subunit [Gemmataceae bacterium]